jgi:recombinational DNA repair protein RecR
LFDRIENSENKIELLVATKPNIEGEATTAYIKEEIKKL